MQYNNEILNKLDKIDPVLLDVSDEQKEHIYNLTLTKFKKIKKQKTIFYTKILSSVAVIALVFSVGYNLYLNTFFAKSQAPQDNASVETAMETATITEDNMDYTVSNEKEKTAQPKVTTGSLIETVKILDNINYDIISIDIVNTNIIVSGICLIDDNEFDFSELNVNIITSDDVKHTAIFNFDLENNNLVLTINVEKLTLSEIKHLEINNTIIPIQND